MTDQGPSRFKTRDVRLKPDATLPARVRLKPDATFGFETALPIKD